MDKVIKFCKKSYSLKSIQRALYDFHQTCGSQIIQTDCEYVITIQDQYVISEEKFREAVLDHELRQQLDKEFGLIRDMLIGRALDSALPRE